MKRLAYLVAAGAVLLGAESSDAGVFELDAQIHGGGMTGTSMSGSAEPFHERAAGATYGFLVGGEFLFLDGWVEHNQYYDSGVNGTWTQFMVGADLQMDLSEPTVKFGPDGKKGKGGYAKWFAEIGFGIGFGVATGAQVDPPLDNSQLSDKGFVGQVKFDVGYRLTKMLSMGVHVPLQMGYMFLQEDDAVANDIDTQYSSVQGALLATVRMHFEI